MASAAAGMTGRARAPGAPRADEAGPHRARLWGLTAALLAHAVIAGFIVLDLQRAPPAAADPDPQTLPLDLSGWPTIRRAPPASPLPTATAPLAPTTPTRAPAEPAPTPPVEDAGSATADAATAPVAADAPEDIRRWRIAQALRRSAACRNRAENLSPDEQAACDRRRARRDDRRADLSDPALARFEAEGAAQLAAYENLRAGLRPPSEETRACPHRTDLMGRCPLQFNVPLYSSQRGLLPGLKKGGD